MPPSSSAVEIPEPVRRTALLAGARSWLAQLPDLITELERTWSISVGSPFPGSTEAMVAPAVTDDGLDVVLKVIVPRDGETARNEIEVLRLVDGDGCAALLRDDVDRGALLVERLGVSLRELALPIRRRHEILCSVARRVWRPAPGSGLPTGAVKGQWLVDFITKTWEEDGRPCSEQAVEHAVGCAIRRIDAHDDERSVIVHGDLHDTNALASGDGFKLVDPDGLLAEAEYDLGIAMREDPLELFHGDPFDRARSLASLTGLDPTAIWEWGVVERVSTGLYASRIGLQPIGRQMLDAADRVAREDP